MTTTDCPFDTDSSPTVIGKELDSSHPSTSFFPTVYNNYLNDDVFLPTNGTDDYTTPTFGYASKSSNNASYFFPDVENTGVFSCSDTDDYNNHMIGGKKFTVLSGYDYESSNNNQSTYQFMSSDPPSSDPNIILQTASRGTNYNLN